MGLLVNVDVPDLARAVDFYTRAFGLAVSRRFGEGAAELRGWPVDLYLLEKPEGGEGAGGEPRRYGRHWTPVHLDVTVDDADAALACALAAGATQDGPLREFAWGRIVTIADPFGNGLCLLQFVGRGYDEIASPAG